MFISAETFEWDTLNGMCRVNVMEAWDKKYVFMELYVAGVYNDLMLIN